MGAGDRPHGNGHVMAITSPRPRVATRRRRPLNGGFLRALPFLVPALALYILFVLVPIGTAMRLSLFRWTGYTGAAQTFVGLDNYRRIFTVDPVFWIAFGNTVIWVVLSLVVPTLIGLLLALALNQRLFARNLFRAVFYIPGVLASIAIASMWRWMYNPQQGVLTGVFGLLGWEPLAKVQWLGDQNVAIFAVFAAFVWQVSGLSMVLFLAGLQSVRQDLVEAARIDGAGAWRVFTNVTMPALRPTMVIVLVLTTINSIKVFDLVVGMTNGGPAQHTQVLALWAYAQSFSNNDFGQGTAISTVLLVLSLALVVPYLVWATSEKRES
jgi:raffinose/stachyose/melibiose transport system permease protein